MAHDLSDCNRAATGFLVSQRERFGGWLLSVVLASPISGACAADAVAGKQKVQQECASCHQPSDWEGETEASLSSLMKDIVRGKVSHHKKQLTLSDQDIENIAAYWVHNKK